MRSFEVAPGIFVTPVLKVDPVYVLNSRKGLMRTIQTDVRLWCLLPNRNAPMMVGHGVTWLSRKDRYSEEAGLMKALDRAFEDAEQYLAVDVIGDEAPVVISREERVNIAEAVRKGYQKLVRRVRAVVEAQEAASKDLLKELARNLKRQARQRQPVPQVPKSRGPLMSDERLASLKIDPDRVV